MSSERFSDLLDVNPKLKYDKPIMTMNGGSRYLDTSGIHSGKYKKIPYQYKDIQYNSGNQSTQTQIDEYLKRTKKQTGGRFYNDNEKLNTSSSLPRPGFATYGNEYLYRK